jgi:two-component system, NtrC family, response regulator AtoC
VGVDRKQSGGRRSADESALRTLSGAAAGTEGRHGYKLLVMASGLAEYELDRDGDFAIGRAPGSDVFIDAHSVSRAHALLTRRGEGLLLRDLGSRNGTFVGGVRLADQPVAVDSGDPIRFGDVLAQIRAVAPAPAGRPSQVGPEDFTRRVADEAERCLRFGRSLAVLAIRADAGRPAGLLQRVMATLQRVDIVVAHSEVRADALLVESSPDEALAAADRILRALVQAGWRTRIGLACFPDDAPSPEACVLSAQAALHSAEAGAVRRGGEGTRTFRVGAREVVVADPAMVRLFGVIERVAPTPVPVLVIGETGSGKEIAVEALHAYGRPGGPLVKINCAAVPELLLESELFGHERGAFSGALEAKPGLFRAADRGTLLLDEIGEMPLALQAKVLRVVEDMRVRPVGGTGEVAVDVRLVAATHRDLKEEVDAGRFRRDLYYRLRGVTLEVPPLRQRPREIPILVERFAQEAAQHAGLASVGFTERALAALRAFAWPGNIRELHHAVSSAVVSHGVGILDLEHLSAEVAAAAPAQVGEPPGPPPALSLEEELQALERRRIEEALAMFGGNQTRAAVHLGMARRTLVAKLRALGIRRQRDPGSSR